MLTLTKNYAVKTGQPRVVIRNKKCETKNKEVMKLLLFLTLYSDLTY